MKNNKEQRELLKEIVGRLKEKEAEAKKKAAESDSLIAWGRQTMIEEVLLMLYQMHDEMVDEALMDVPSKAAENTSIETILSKSISFLCNKMTRRAYVVLRNAGFQIVADIYGSERPLTWRRGCGVTTHKEILAGLKSIGLPDPDGKDTFNPEDYGFKLYQTDGEGHKLYKKIEEE